MRIRIVSPEGRTVETLEIKSGSESHARRVPVRVARFYAVGCEIVAEEKRGDSPRGIKVAGNGSYYTRTIGFEDTRETVKQSVSRGKLQAFRTECAERAVQLNDW